MDSYAVCPFTAVAYVDDDARATLLIHPDSERVLAFDSADEAFCFVVALGLAGLPGVGSVAAPVDRLLHVVGSEEEATDLVRQIAFASTRRAASAEEFDDQHVLAVLRASGGRGASHEDFFEAGLGPRYVPAMRRLVDLQGYEVNVDFTTGAARWVLVRQPAAARSPRALAA